MSVTLMIYFGFVSLECYRDDLDFISHLFSEENIVLVFPLGDVRVVYHYKWLIHYYNCMNKGTPTVLVCFTYQPRLELFRVGSVVKFGYFLEVVICRADIGFRVVLVNVGCFPASRDSSHNFQLFCITHSNLVAKWLLSIWGSAQNVGAICCSI